MDSEKIATTYLRYFEAKRETDIWARDEVDTLVLRDPERGWEITRTLVNKALTEEALAYIAAGPLEDLLNHHGAAVMVQIEQECLTNDNLRLALSGVWIENENPVWQRWYALMWKCGFAEGRRQPL